MPPFQAARELIRRVQTDCAVEIDGNAYSVPWRLIGETVRATVVDGIVRIHHGTHEVAVHPVCVGRRHRVIEPAHFEGEWRSLHTSPVLMKTNYMPGDPKECHQRALRCTELAERAADSELKAVLKSLAERWLKMAAELERAQALRDELRT
jgi:hypothetical protein